MARPRRPAQASRATRTAIACATRCARKRKTRRSVKPASRKRNSVASKRNSALSSLMKRLFAVASLLCAACAVAAEAPRKIVSLEGVTEYQLANGLRLLTLPDPGIDTVTVQDRKSVV